jgi:hypothetical protein
MYCDLSRTKSGFDDLALQELNQADISLIHKTELLERLTTIRKAFDKQRKDKENAANKAVRLHHFTAIVGVCSLIPTGC